VVKGNGYGFGNARLAAEAEKLGIDLLAIGTYDELPAVRTAYSGDVLVLSPWRPGVETPRDDRLVHTVSRPDDLEQLARTAAPTRVVLELLTSMRRHGLTAAGVAALAPLISDPPDPRYADTRIEGFALHLPL